MGRVYMVQPCDVHGAGEVESAYLPYASGLLIAYSFRLPEVRDNCSFGRFIYRKEDIDTAIESLEDPVAVGFSTYIWNYEYNKEFARRLKARYPGCATVFGGHNIASHSSRQLEEFPFIDFLIHGEGEIAFGRILTHLLTDGDYSGIPNISYRDGGKVVMNRPEPILTLDYPSPYLDGWFDSILEQDKIRFSVLFETNRGCPFHCAYCDWGSKELSMRHFPTERVVAELDWFGRHGIDYCFCIDSNFGMFPRDFDIVDEFLRVKEKYGQPEVFKCCTTEGGGMKEFAINKKLNDCGIFKGASLALQTLCPEALENIGRKNMSIENYRELTGMYNEAGITAYSDMIFGLPGETYESFSDSMEVIIEAGATQSFFMHYCELLINSRLCSAEYVDKFKIKTARLPYTQFHSSQDCTVTEYQNIIVSTYSMSYDMWVKTCIFGLFIQCFYYMGMLKNISQYLYFEHSVGYKRFFEELIAFAEKNPGTVIGSFYEEMYLKLSALNRGEELCVAHCNPEFGDIEYPLEEAMYLECISRAGEFFCELTPFFRSFAADDGKLDEVILYQKTILKKPGDGPEKTVFSSEYPEYFRNIAVNRYSPLRESESVIVTEGTGEYGSAEDFATKCVWYGRKHSGNIYPAGR